MDDPSAEENGGARRWGMETTEDRKSLSFRERKGVEWKREKKKERKKERKEEKNGFLFAGHYSMSKGEQDFAVFSLADPSPSLSLIKQSLPEGYVLK